MDNVCPYGLPQSGTWFVGLAGNTDAFTMQLSAPLVAGQCYEISFWDQGYASALTAVLLAILALVGLLQFFVLDRRTHYR